MRLAVLLSLSVGLVMLKKARTEFLSPGSFRNVVIQGITVTQTCADEFLCRSSSFNATNCVSQGVCAVEQECNGRIDFPGLEHPLRDWQATLNGQNAPGCTLVNKTPDNPPSVTFATTAGRTLIVNGSATNLNPCFTQRSEPLNSSFSLVFWLRADCKNCSVLEIHQRGGESLHLRVVGDSLCVNTDCSAILQTNQWILITLWASVNEFAIYGGENRINFPGSAFHDISVENLYIGSSEIIPMADFFELFDVRFYTDALSSREILYLKNGLPDPSLNCRCPSGYPDIVSSDDTLCTDDVSTVARYNSSVHFYLPEVMIDEREDTLWASSDQGVVTFTLDLGRSFQIGLISLLFTSSLPSRIESTFVSSGRDNQARQFVCSGSNCTIDITQENAPNTIEEYRQLTADTLKISMHRDSGSGLESFVISELVVTGRCDCQGNARSCTYDDNDGNYKCICDFETNTRGINCGTCELNFARSLSQFGCPNACSCNVDGVANENDKCDQVNGLCKCKKNVEGPFCDICKPFTYKLEESNPDGCSVCSCNQRGSLLCSNTTGQCQCQDNTVSDKCDRCADDSFGFADGCQLCDCSSAGTLEQRTNCTESGQCACKENVMGLKCNSCKPGFYGLNSNNVMGCVACSCHSIGAENTTCDSLTGQCQCKGGDVTDLACTPVILSIDPTFGPEVGGTLVTIKGRLFGKDTSNVKIFLGDKLQQIISIDESTIVFRTLQYNKTDGSDNKSPSLHLQWKGVNDITNTPLKFEYVSDPMYDFTRNTEVITYQRGGCHVEVYGSNLNNVKKPRLEFTNTARPGVNVYGTCFHKMNHIRCITPNLKSILATSGNNFIMKVLLDGFEAVRDVNVLPDPVLDDAGSIKFQYPFEDSVDLSGKNLKSSCSVSVFLGVINCEIKHLSDTSIQFAPPVSPPGGRKKHIIEVHIGESKMTAGTLEYLELYETTGFIIIVSCIAAAIIIAVVGVIICCCCRIRRNQAPPSSRSTSAKTTTASSNKQSVEVDTRPMNNYSELVTLVDASVAPATSNGHNSLVQMETVVKEHKKGIVNSEAEDNILAEEFLPRVEPGIRDGVKKCYIGAGHFVPGRACIIRGRHIQLVNGTLQRNGAAVQKLTIKSVIHHLTEQNLPTWANLALSECLRLKHFKHNHILSIIGIGANQHTFHIVYPSMTQGTLKAVISDTSKDFSVRQLLGFGQQVAEGIDFLASKDVTHKDVAARNCMMDEYSVVKLSDASFSWDLYPNEYMYDESRERHLPIRWMAPESLQDGYYDMRTDVWSFAVLVWELLTRGCLPFHEVTDSAGVSEYILQGYILGRPDTLSIDVYELLRICWSPENESRPSIATVSRTLSEILEADDDETYANAGELASYQQQHSSGLAASPRHHAGKTSTQP